jgi:PASTA domain
VADEDGRTGRSAAWGVAALVFGAGAIYVSQLATTPKPTFPIWPTYVLGGIAAVALYLCFSTIWGWWPTARLIRAPLTGATQPYTAAHDPAPTDTVSDLGMSASPVRSTTGAPASRPAPSVAIQHPGQGATTFSPDTEILDSGETPHPRSKSGRSPERTCISRIYENPPEIGGLHGALKREQRWPGGRRWAWLTVVLAVLALIAVEASLQTGNGVGSAYTVPQVDNLPVGKAVSEIKADGLVPDVVAMPVCLTQLGLTGVVMDTLPVNGEGIGKGGTVTVYVCTDIGLPVPQVVDLPLSTAIQQLGDYGFKYTIHYSPAPAADNIPTGVVWNQNPEPQTTYTFGSSVTLWVQSQASASPTLTR